VAKVQEMVMATRRPLIGGNWKMHGLRRSTASLEEIIRGYQDLAGRLDLIVFPPATLLASFAEITKGSGVGIGAQDCHAEPSGAFTGDISPEMVADCGASAAIVGHSERRTYHNETDGMVHNKVLGAWRAGLMAVACVGETRTERENGRTLDVVARQLAGSIPDRATAENLVIAYEPVWAIGTGLTPTPDDVAQVHGFIRESLVRRFGQGAESMRIIYGGSVRPGNAKELMAVPDVDGSLVGGASLKADEFLGIAAVYR
jgi:triosephosphate isomerase (TIM)